MSAITMKLDADVSIEIPRGHVETMREPVFGEIYERAETTRHGGSSELSEARRLTNYRRALADAVALSDAIAQLGWDDDDEQSRSLELEVRHLRGLLVVAREMAAGRMGERDDTSEVRAFADRVDWLDAELEVMPADPDSPAGAVEYEGVA